jgi:hypothetical protein
MIAGKTQLCYRYPQVFDMNGKLVYQTADIIGNKIFLNSNLPKGLYIFKLFTTGGSVNWKLVNE